MPKKELMDIAEYNFQAAKSKLAGSAKGGLYHAYARVLMHNGQYKIAIPHLKEAKIDLVKSPNLENYLLACEDLMKAYEQTGQLEKISGEFQDYKKFQDTLVATVYSQQLLELEEQYKTEKKANENTKLQAQNNIIQTRFRLSTIILILLFFMLVTVFYLFQKLKKNKQQLESANADKNKIFAILAHDLKNPITSLRNLSGKVKFLTERNRLEELDDIAKQTDDKLGVLNDNLNNILMWAVTESDWY